MSVSDVLFVIGVVCAGIALGAGILMVWIQWELRSREKAAAAVPAELLKSLEEQRARQRTAEPVGDARPN